jgi:hypothetical protein
LRLFDALRPMDYRVTIIAPDGSTTESPKFATSAEACKWAKANANSERDVVMKRFANSAANN